MVSKFNKFRNLKSHCTEHVKMLGLFIKRWHFTFFTKPNEFNQGTFIQCKQCLPPTFSGIREKHQLNMLVVYPLQCVLNYLWQAGGHLWRHVISFWVCTVINLAWQGHCELFSFFTLTYCALNDMKGMAVYWIRNRSN